MSPDVLYTFVYCVHSSQVVRGHGSSRASRTSFFPVRFFLTRSSFFFFSNPGVVSQPLKSLP